jgi:hypothetical protein
MQFRKIEKQFFYRFLFILCRCSSICKVFPGDADFCGQVERELVAERGVLAIPGVLVAERVCTIVGRENLGVVFLLRRKSPLASLSRLRTH